MDWNRDRCNVCGSREELVSFYLDVVCLNCRSELKRIAAKKFSELRDVVIYYVKAQARFIHKGECETASDLLNTLTLDQLNKLSYWLIKMSRIDLF